MQADRANTSHLSGSPLLGRGGRERGREGRKRGERGRDRLREAGRKERLGHMRGMFILNTQPYVSQETLI